MLSLEARGAETAVRKADYGYWQQLFADAFFGRSNTPVVLFVDDDELARLAPGTAQPAVSLAAAVAELLFLSGGRRIFQQILRMQKIWEQGDQMRPPPTLPLLALTVLAASRMHREPEIAAHNFYTRMAQVLVPNVEQKAMAAVRTAVVDSFEEVSGMWKLLDRWLKVSGGERGISTIRDHPGLSRIGFPLSQAVLRKSDRAKLTLFFSHLNVSAAGAPDATSLLSYLGMWMSVPRGFSEAFCKMARDQAQADLMGPLLVGLADNWDGRVVTSEGLRRLELKLCLNIHRQRVDWAISAADGIDEDVLQGEIAGEAFEVKIERDPYSSLYQLDRSLPAASRYPIQKITLVGSHCAAKFSPSDVIVFSEDPDAGCWLSRHSVEFGAEHLIAARGDAATSIRRVFAEAAQEGWRVLPSTGGASLMPGWKLFSRVVFDDADRLRAALEGTALLRTDAVRPAPVVRPQLKNGLRLARQVTQAAYLSGAEPDLLLPFTGEGRVATAALDGVEQHPPFSASGLPISLRRIGPLAPGTHELRVGDIVLTFHVVDAEPGGVEPCWGELGWDANAEPSDQQDQFEVCGAVIQGPADVEPVLARRGQDETWLLHADGACTRVEEPEAAEVLERATGIAPYYFEVSFGRSAVWLAQRRGEVWQIRLLRALPPSLSYLDPVSASLWARVSDQSVSADPLWGQYMLQWGRHCGR
ncbi:hypothetical protein ACFWNN_22310 [Lentzea sp. NPDC058450]|uniref:hypothetical protein n=1 Tax=Lentzea sp. NPDC058450 TaxID=3346505 RepID=UPI00364FC3BB